MTEAYESFVDQKHSYNPRDEYIPMIDTLELECRKRRDMKYLNQSGITAGFGGVVHRSLSEGRGFRLGNPTRYVKPHQNLCIGTSSSISF